MRIEEGDTFRLDNGDIVKVASVFDLYDDYHTDTNVGTNPRTHVRCSDWWLESQIVAPQTVPVQEFVDKIDERVEDGPETQRP